MDVELVLRNKSFYLILLIFCALLIQAVFDKGADVYYYSVLILILGFLSTKYQKIKIDLHILVFCLSGFIFLTLSYWLLGRFDEIPVRLIETYTKIANQYFWVIPLLFLPYLIVFFNQGEKYIFEPLIFFTSFIFIYTFYNSFILDFNRGLLSQFFNPIIIFDITFISLAFFALFYSFLKEGVVSYFYLVLSLLLIFVLILHGTRGTWIGLPLVLIAYTLHFYKYKIKKVILMLSLSLSFILINIVWDNSPIKNRLQQFSADTVQLAENNYKTSSGVRIFLWKESLEIFENNQIIGVGGYGIEAHNCELKESGQLPTCFQHMHNIFFHELAAHGILGLLGLVLIYGSILLFFIKKFLRYFSNFELRGYALLGIIYVVYYLICGLTEYYLFFVLPVYIHYFIILLIVGFIFRKEAILTK